MLKRLSIIASFLTAIGIYLIVSINGSNDYRYLINLWIIVVASIGAFLIYTFLNFLVVAVMSLFVKNNKRRYHFIYLIFVHFIKYINDLAGIKVKVEGLENIPKDQKCMIVYNHKSNFDPMLIVYYLRHHDFIAISKPENFKIPICGPFMKAVDYLAINRDSPKEAAIIINKAIDYIKDNKYSICVAPEGTRNKISDGLLEFHSGTFKIATKSKAPIMIITMTNTRSIHKNFPFKKTIVEFKIAKLIEYEEIENLNTHEISDKVRKIMMEQLNIEEKE